MGRSARRPVSKGRLAGSWPWAGHSDENLVARLRVGDETAFEAVYDRYADGVLAFCVHMLKSREAAEDALQVTFVSAYRALRYGEGCVSLRPWLYTIARNQCLSELRARRDEADLDGVGDRPSFDGPAEQLQRREQLRELLEDMRQLPIDQRAALVLFELGDQSQAEIATVLGVRRDKVKALIFQAREALIRGRKARNSPCAEMRERIATAGGKILARSMTRAHIDRCPTCAAFEAEVSRQHAALALILPVTATVGLKASVIGAALSSGGIAAGVTGGATAAIGGSALAGGGSAAGAGALGATTSLAAGSAASGIGLAAEVPTAAVMTGVVSANAGVAALVTGSSGLVTKLVVVAAIAGGVAGAGGAISTKLRVVGSRLGLSAPAALTTTNAARLTPSTKGSRTAIPPRPPASDQSRRTPAIATAGAPPSNGPGAASAPQPRPSGSGASTASGGSLANAPAAASATTMAPAVPPTNQPAASGSQTTASSPAGSSSPATSAAPSTAAASSGSQTSTTPSGTPAPGSSATGTTPAAPAVTQPTAGGSQTATTPATAPTNQPIPADSTTAPQPADASGGAPSSETHGRNHHRRRRGG